MKEILSFPMFELALLVLIICVLCWVLPQLSNSPSRRSTPARTSSKPAIQQRLYQLVYGDRATADRLLRQARSRYPDRSEQWILEKVVFDLERDRRW